MKVYNKDFANGNKAILDYFENLLLDNGCDIENYEDPERGISQLLAIENEILKLIDYKYMYMDLCK